MWWQLSFLIVESQGNHMQTIIHVGLKWNTCENGSSSELGKSYWLRSLGLNTEGPECWGADRGEILGFFSYFLLVRTASTFSGFGKTKKTTCLYSSVRKLNGLSKGKTRMWLVTQGFIVCVQALKRLKKQQRAKKRHWYADGSTCQMPLLSQMVVIHPHTTFHTNFPRGRAPPCLNRLQFYEDRLIIFSP